MTTLHIEHAITDYSVWRTAFDRFEPVRRDAGVLAARVSRPVEDDHYVVVQLDFAEREHATGFLVKLRTQIWANPGDAPALVGTPRTMILRGADQVAVSTGMRAPTPA